MQVSLLKLRAEIFYAQVQFQLQQAPASFLAVVHQAQLQLLQQQQQQKASEQKGTVLKQQQIKAAIEGNVKMQESSPQSRDVAGGDGGSSQQSADSWQDRAQASFLCFAKIFFHFDTIILFHMFFWGFFFFRS